jgi:uncharacterized membrane protein
VILIMLSNHFPTITYGHNLNWLLLMLFVVVGAGARHLIIGKGLRAPTWAAIAFATAALLYLTITGAS